MTANISLSEKQFLIDGFAQDIRTDGRSSADARPFALHPGTVPEAFGSCTLTFGQQDIQIVCAIKAEILTPLRSEPDKGQVNVFLESTQTGRSLFVREDQADQTKQRMLHVLEQLITNSIDRKELAIQEAQYAWTLNIDILVFDELHLEQLDYACLCARAALQNLALPQTIATMNNNTGKIEVGLVEEIYTDKDNTDSVTKLASAGHSPFVVSLGIIRNVSGEDEKPIILVDADPTEQQCIDQILHIAASKSKSGKVRIHSMVSSKGMGSSITDSDSSTNGAVSSVVPGLPACLFLSANLKPLLEYRLECLAAESS